ncbi:MAG: porin family protein [Bacteroidales bacterium]|nr:porin family protein [Bacteroidales bacterium]
MLKIIISMLLAFIVGSGRGYAQEIPYKFNAGIGLGMSGYAGDASSSLFSHPGFSAHGSFRYQYDARWYFGGSFSTLSISGNTADMNGVLPGGAVYDFKSQVYDLGGRVDFNFFPYGMGETFKNLRRWTPYLTLGVGVSLASCDGETAIGPNIPMGAGIRYKLNERWNLQLEFIVTKVFNDHIDGPDLSDLTMIKSSFLKNNDWYSRLSVGITYEFGRRCETCHYVD